jgi:cyclic nucleotide gated channel, plant
MAYITSSLRMFGRSGLVMDVGSIARRYLGRFFVVDLLSLLLQANIWHFFHKRRGEVQLPIKNGLFVVMLSRWVPRFVHFYPITSKLKRSTSVFEEMDYDGATFFLTLSSCCYDMDDRGLGTGVDD